ncbi:glycosyltransferase [Asticcacaulis sp.]|uniref:glycosyltransferase n=1 Tax=Asticcacaulis sp. TaxID=1872648 RepID=UPI003F7C9D81
MFGTGFTRFLPKGLRNVILGLSNDYHFGSPHIRYAPVKARRAYRGERVAIAGLFSVRCGLQRAADLMAMDMEARGIPVFRMDMAKALRLVTDIERTDTGGLKEMANFAPTDIIIHAAPPLFNRFLSKLGREAYSRSAIIPYWHWELAEAPSDWGKALKWADGIWAPTPFVADAIRAVMPEARPIRIVPNAVDADPFAPVSDAEAAKARAYLGIDKEAFVAGFTFSMASGFWRKNPLGAIEAFQAAFPKNQAARLILRCHDCALYPAGYDLLKAAALADARILLFDGRDRKIGLGDFYAVIDVLLSLHRSEGFGLTLAEALQSGRRVITTDWGLAPELAADAGVVQVQSCLVPVQDPQGIYEDYTAQKWAEADIGAAAKALQALAIRS